MTKKILYSPGYGAGWSTWVADKKIRLKMLTYKPLIEAIEMYGNSSEQWGRAIGQFEKDFPDVYMGGARSLRVAIVSGPFRVVEYDGSESIVEPGIGEWIQLEDLT